MAQEYKGQNPLDIAKQAEKDMNSLENRSGTGKSSDSGTYGKAQFRRRHYFQEGLQLHRPASSL